MGARFEPPADRAGCAPGLPPASQFGSKWLPLLLIAGILAAGSWVRVVDLGDRQFSMDEATHYYASRSLADGRGPLLPSGQLYTRGIDLERMTVVIERVLTHPETALRLPAALFGVLGLFLFAAVGWAMVGAWPTVWALLLLAIYPEAILQSRDGRFYTYQLCFGLLALYAGWRTLEACAERSVRRAWLWAAVTGLFFLLGARVQVVTLSVAAGFGLALACAALAGGLHGLRADWRQNAALQICAVALLLLAVAAAALPALARDFVAGAFFVPLWAGAVPGDPRFYHWSLSDVIPLFYSLSPVSFAVALGLNWRIGLLLCCWFGVPFLTHSLALPWKGERFLLSAMPALFLATGIGASALAAAVRRAAELRVAGLGLGPPFVRGAAALLVAVVSLFAVVSTPAFNLARKIPPASEDFDWRLAAKQIERLSEGRSLPVGSSMPLPALFYFGRLDFTVGTDYLEGGVEGGVVSRTQGAIDYYSGTPVLTQPDRIRSEFHDAPAVFIAIDPDRLQYGNIDPALPPVLRAEGREICEGRCRGLQLYYWPLR